MRNHHRLGRRLGRRPEEATASDVAPSNMGSWSGLREVAPADDFGEIGPAEDFGEIGPPEDLGFLAGIDVNSAAISALAGVGVAAVTGKPLYGLLAGLGTYFGAQYLLSQA